jgi:cytochrome P450
MRALARAHLDRLPTGEAVAALPLLRALVLEVVLRVVVGGVSDEGRRVALRDALYELLLPEPMSAPAVKRMKGLIGAEVTACRSGSAGVDSGDVLSLLLDARHDDGSTLSDEEVRDEPATLLMTATGTTSGSLAWALERLARNGEALARATAEAREGGGPFIDAVIQETLRMRPTVPAVARLAKNTYRLGSREVAPGTVIAVSVLLLHHHPDVYEEPMAFRPERFLDAKPGTYTWIPFGGGVRRCVGASFALLEMRIVLTALLSRISPQAPDPEPEAAQNRLNTMVPAAGARLVFTAL